jgi:hypothetical protein
MTGLVPVIRPNAIAFGDVAEPQDVPKLAGSGAASMAGTSPAMTEIEFLRPRMPLLTPIRVQRQNKKYLCAIGSLSAGSHTSSTPSAVTA